MRSFLLHNIPFLSQNFQIRLFWRKIFKYVTQGQKKPLEAKEVFMSTWPTVQSGPVVHYNTIQSEPTVYYNTGWAYRCTVI